MEMATPGHHPNPIEPPYSFHRSNRRFMTPRHAIVKGFVYLTLLQRLDLPMNRASRSRVDHKVIQLHFRHSSCLPQIGILLISCPRLMVNLTLSKTLPRMTLSQVITQQDGNAKEYRALAKDLTLGDPIPHSSISTTYPLRHRRKTL